jgi:hypothetical protein
MKLGAQDLRLLKEFVGGAGEGSSPKFTISRGAHLDGNWMPARTLKEAR